MSPHVSGRRPSRDPEGARTASGREPEGSHTASGREPEGAPAVPGQASDGEPQARPTGGDGALPMPARAGDGVPVPSGRASAGLMRQEEASGPDVPEAPRRHRRVWLVVLAGAVLSIAALLTAFPLWPSAPVEGDPDEGLTEPASSGIDGAGEHAPVVLGGPMPTGLGDTGLSGDLVGYASAPLGVRATWRVDASLEATCAQVLGAYESQGDVELHQSGYLDLLGNTWACLVAGPSWVEVALVQDGGGDTGEVGAHSYGGPCTLSVMRLGQQAIEQGQGVGEAEG